MQHTPRRRLLHVRRWPKKPGCTCTEEAMLLLLASPRSFTTQNVSVSWILLALKSTLPRCCSAYRSGHRGSEGV